MRDGQRHYQWRCGNDALAPVDDNSSVAALVSRNYNYVCSQATTIEKTMVEFPRTVTLIAILKSGHWAAEGWGLDLTYQRIGANRVNAIRKLVRDQEHNVCSHDYYNRVRPGIVKMRGALRASTIYE